MFKKDNIIYGTLKECTDELFTETYFNSGKFPDFDYAVCVENDIKSIEEAKRSAHAWFGCKNVGYLYDSSDLDLVFSYYGGGGFDHMEISREYFDDNNFKEDFMRKIDSSAEMCGYSLAPDEYTVFEIITEEVRK